MVVKYSKKDSYFEKLTNCQSPTKPTPNKIYYSKNELEGVILFQGGQKTKFPLLREVTMTPQSLQHTGVWASYVTSL